MQSILTKSLQCQYTKNSSLSACNNDKTRIWRLIGMHDIGSCRKIFEKYGGIVRTKQLEKEGIFYKKLQQLIVEGYVRKVRVGCYQWNDLTEYSELSMLIRLYPDGIFCMDTALRYYGYRDGESIQWHIAVDKDSGKSRFNIDYPLVKPYYLEPTVLWIGQTKGRIDGCDIQIYDKERVICDCLRYRNKMDKKVLENVIENYMNDPEKRIHRLLEYAKLLRISKIARNMVEQY